MLPAGARPYAEPFAGMCGILLQRAPATSEIVNDLDGNLANWWRCIRDAPDDFARRIEATPWCDRGFHEARALLAEPWDFAAAPDLDSGLAFHIQVAQSIRHSPVGASFAVAVSVRRSIPQPEVHRLAERLRGVQILNRDAVGLLERLAPERDAIIYVDPPYPSADTKPYARLPDYDGLRSALRAQQGRVAVSGYGAEWDCLGWPERREFSTQFVSMRGDAPERRTEVVWLNFRPEGENRLFG